MKYSHTVPAPRQPIQITSQTLRQAEVQKYQPDAGLFLDQEMYFLFDQKIELNGIQYTNRVKEITANPMVLRVSHSQVSPSVYNR